MFTVLALYPIIERKLTGDTASHHLLQRPRDVPVRTSLGAMALTFYVCADGSPAATTSSPTSSTSA